MTTDHMDTVSPSMNFDAVINELNVIIGRTKEFHQFEWESCYVYDDSDPRLTDDQLDDYMAAYPEYMINQIREYKRDLQAEYMLEMAEAGEIYCDSTGAFHYRYS